MLSFIPANRKGWLCLPIIFFRVADLLISVSITGTKGQGWTTGAFPIRTVLVHPCSLSLSNGCNSLWILSYYGSLWFSFQEVILAMEAEIPTKRLNYRN
jgi:hypothetical protein